MERQTLLEDIRFVLDRLSVEKLRRVLWYIHRIL